jgi:hypothetical protein
MIVMDPSPLRHRAAAGALDVQHLAFGGLIAELVVVDFIVVAEHREVARAAAFGNRELEHIPGNSAMVDALAEFHFAGFVGEDEALNNDVGRRLFKTKPGDAC